jgi:hypothetical protein
MQLGKEEFISNYISEIFSCFLFKVSVEKSRPRSDFDVKKITYAYVSKFSDITFQYELGKVV